MKYCRNCGKEIDDKAVICTNCGAAVEENLKKVVSSEKDTGGFGWGFLGFLFPLIGLILYLVWKDEKPITAKAVGTGALVGFVFEIIALIPYFLLVSSYMYY